MAVKLCEGFQEKKWEGAEDVGKWGNEKFGHVACKEKFGDSRAERGTEAKGIGNRECRRAGEIKNLSKKQTSQPFQGDGRDNIDFTWFE